MEQPVACSPSAVPSTTKKCTRTPYLTPCRRLGLARKSPASNSSLHENRSPNFVSSAYKSPIQNTPERHSEVMHAENVNCVAESTPFRNISRSEKKRALSKRFKCSFPLSAQTCNEDQISESTHMDMSEIQETSNFQEIKVTLCSETDVVEEITLPSEEITKKTIEKIKTRIKEKEERLRELNRSQIYKKKHDVNTLKKLIQQWLEGCQAALRELQSLVLAQGQTLSMEDLLRQLNIPRDLVKYKTDLEDFE